MTIRAHGLSGAGMHGIKVLAFDTGGTILDWHGGIAAGLAECGARRGVEHDWHELANDYRRRSLRRMLGAVEPDFNIDDVHRDMLDELLSDNGITAFSSEDRRDRGTVARARRLAGLCAGTRASAAALCLHILHDPEPVTGDRSLASERDRLGCSDPVRDAARLQDPTRGVSTRRKAPRGAAQRNLDGRLPQFRSRRSAWRRLPNRLHPPPGRMGAGRPAGPDPKHKDRRCGRRICRACRAPRVVTAGGGGGTISCGGGPWRACVGLIWWLWRGC